MGTNNSKRRYPADALGVRVEVVDAILYDDDDDGRSVAAKIVSDDLILVSRRYPIEMRRHAAAVARRTVLEMGLPAGEMEACAADLADLARKLGPAAPMRAAEAAQGMPEGGYTLDRDERTGLSHCPLCKRKTYKRAENLWDHMRKVHDYECWLGGWLPRDMYNEVVRLHIERLRWGGKGG